jgi:hypothetical protein
VQQTAVNLDAISDSKAEPAVSARKGWLWLLVLPICFVILQLVFVRAHGPFYLAHNLDPDYAYLGNSLNVLRLKAPRHIDHPGTTLQVFGAIVLKVAHPFSSNREIVSEVWQNPERHLHLINFALASMYFFCLVLAGILLWRRTGRLLPSLTLQATPFVLGNHFREVSRVTPEFMLLSIGILMATGLYLGSLDLKRKTLGTLPLGALAALGTVTKMSFAPLAVAALPCFARWRERAAYLGCAAVVGLLWLIPLAGQKDRLMQWTAGLAFRQGRHGTGEAGILPAEYLSNLFRLLVENPFITAAVALGWTAALYGLLRFKSTHCIQGRRWSWLLLGLVLGQTFQILIVAKYGFGNHRHWRYLFPTVMLYPLNVLLLLEIANLLWPQYSWWPKLRLLMVCVALGLPTFTLRAHYYGVAKATAERLEFAQTLEAVTAGQPKVFLHTTSSPYYAVFYADMHAGGHYSKLLRNSVFSNQPPTYVVSQNTGDLSFLSRQYGHLSSITTGTFFLAGFTNFQHNVLSFLPAEATPRKVFQKGREVIYKVEFAGRAPE